ncbi:MAG TPA: Crp/Fnr family transcriptional regulator [Actinomycetota bacterium]|jgi:CRP-like cAMP-binding protein
MEMSAGPGGTGNFLEQLTPAQRADLEAVSRRRRYPRGATIFNEGDIADRVFVLLEGTAKIAYFSAEGKETVLAVRGSGDILGELSALDGEPLSATVATLEEVTGLVVSSDAFTSYLRVNPDVTLLLLRTVTRKLRDADRKRIEFASFDTVGRVARRLVELAQRFGSAQDGRIDIELRLSQEELAAWTSASREAVSKALQTLRSRGWIETKRRSVTVLDLAALRRRGE